MPLAEEWIKLEEGIGARPLLSGTTDDMAQQYAGLVALLSANAPPPDPAVKTEDRKVGEVPIRIYTPEGSEGKKLPIAVYTHGGGFVLGGLDDDDALCRIISKATPAIVVATDYRLGPTHKQPAMIDDSYEVLKWAHANGASIGGDPEVIFTTGGSAGGGLALALAEKSISDGENLVKGIAAMVPLTIHPDNVPEEYKADFTSYTVNAKDVPIIDAASMATFYDAVDANKDDPNQFVGLSKNLAKFPPTYIAVCEFDPLRSDGEIIEKMLKKAGVKTKLDFYEGLPHYFWIFQQLPQAAVCIGNMLQGIQFVLGKA